MTRTSREKLNAIHLNGSLILAAIFSAITESWWLFILIAISLIGSSVYSGEIRHHTVRRR